MPAGKLSAQAGHAYGDSICNSRETHPEIYNAYRAVDGNGGSKVTLQAKNVNHLMRAYNEAIAYGLPCAIIVDREHILPPHFDGSPIITAVGIGPCTKIDAKNITKRFQCVK
jgi:peptidyl-tRNA hydrolase